MVKKTEKKKENEKSNLMNTILIIGFGLYSLAKFAGLLSLNGSNSKIYGNTTTGTLNIKDIPTYTSNQNAKDNGAENGTVYKRNTDGMLLIVY